MYMLGKVTALGVLCCFALFVCLILLASFFLPSHLSFKNMYSDTRLIPGIKHADTILQKCLNGSTTIIIIHLYIAAIKIVNFMRTVSDLKYNYIYHCKT